MIKIRKPIVVEGKYDKIKLSSFLDALIITTDGFSIFKDREKLEMLRALAQKTGIIILTDSDKAGFKIRNYINSCIPNELITHAYIPDVLGKEKRKDTPSKEGKLGVEGIEKEIVLEALERAGAIGDHIDDKLKKITKLDFFMDGLTGTPNSSLNRRKLIGKLNLPEHISSNALLGVLNSMFTYDEYQKMILEVLS